jgi:hypothetical protein
VREHEWINTPEARQRRGERSLFALTDILNALNHGHTPPPHAMSVMQEISRETARAASWRMLQRLRRHERPDTMPLPAPLAEPEENDK